MRVTFIRNNARWQGTSGHCHACLTDVGRPMLVYHSVHAFQSIDPSEARKSVRKKRTLIWKRVIFQNFRKVRFRVPLFFFLFFIWKCWLLSKKCRACVMLWKSVYGRRFKSIYSSDIVHLILHLMWLISICHHYKKQETNAILRKMKIRLNRYDYQSVKRWIFIRKILNVQSKNKCSN